MGHFKNGVLKACDEVILYGSEAWCLKVSEMGTLRTEKYMVRALCGVQLKDIETSMDLMFMLGLNETIDQLAMVNSARWYGHVLRREDCHVLRRACVCRYITCVCKYICTCVGRYVHTCTCIWVRVVPLRPFLCAALAKRWKVQFCMGLH